MGERVDKMMPPNHARSEPGGSVAVAIVASRAPGLPRLRDWVVRCQSAVTVNERPKA